MTSYLIFVYNGEWYILYNFYEGDDTEMDLIEEIVVLISKFHGNVVITGENWFPIWF